MPHCKRRTPVPTNTCCPYDFTKGGCRFSQVPCGACERKLCPRKENDCQKEINNLLAKLEDARLQLRCLKNSFRKRDATCECCGDGKTHTGRKQYCIERNKLERKIYKLIKRIIALKKSCRDIKLIPNSKKDCKCANYKKCSKCPADCDRVKTWSDNHGACILFKPECKE